MATTYSRVNLQDIEKLLIFHSKTYGLFGNKYFNDVNLYLFFFNDENI